LLHEIRWTASERVIQGRLIPDPTDDYDFFLHYYGPGLEPDYWHEEETEYYAQVEEEEKARQFEHSCFLQSIRWEACERVVQGRLIPDPNDEFDFWWTKTRILSWEEIEYNTRVWKEKNED
jgi:hypothetical protein